MPSRCKSATARDEAAENAKALAAVAEIRALWSADLVELNDLRRALYYEEQRSAALDVALQFERQHIRDLRAAIHAHALEIADEIANMQ